MKKVVIRATGGPEALKLIEVADPVPGENEVLVDLKATGLNWSELMIRRGDWPIEISADGFTPGSEGAGVVEKTGPGVTDVQPGDRVLVFDFNAYQKEGQGCYAEKIAVARDRILKYPEDLDFVEAAAVPMAALTAYDALINHSPLPESGTVVITACTGAVGIAAIQLAKRKGLRVIGTTRRESQRAHIHSLGAEVVVAPDPFRLKEEVENLVKDEGVDYIFDPISGETATQLISLLNFNGTYVIYGILSGGELKLPDNFLFHQARVHGYVILLNLADPKSLQAAWNEVLPLIETKEILIPVHKTFPLEDAAKAHEEMENHPHWGKIVLVQEG